MQQFLFNSVTFTLFQLFRLVRGARTAISYLFDPRLGGMRPQLLPHIQSGPLALLGKYYTITSFYIPAVFLGSRLGCVVLAGSPFYNKPRAYTATVSLCGCIF